MEIWTNLDKGREGVKNSANFADIRCTWSLNLAKMQTRRGSKILKICRHQFSAAPIYFCYMFPMVPMVSKRGSCSAQARMSDIPCAEKQIWWSGGKCIFFCARVSSFSVTNLNSETCQLSDSSDATEQANLELMRSPAYPLHESIQSCLVAPSAKASEFKFVYKYHKSALRVLYSPLPISGADEVINDRICQLLCSECVRQASHANCFHHCGTSQALDSSASPGIQLIGRSRRTEIKRENL